MRDDIFIQLVEAVEAEGGELLAETHFPYPIPYKIKGQGGRVKLDERQSTGCGQDTLFSFPYEKPSLGDTVELGTIKLCAIDDRMDLMPRFQARG